MTDEMRELKQEAHRIRTLIVKTIGNAGAGHTGGALSAVEILTTLFFHTMKVDPANPQWPERDRFILSKGHSSVVLYCALAEKGYFPHSTLDEFDHVDGSLQGHPDMNKTPGVDISTGSLGMGLSAGIGMALAGIYKKIDFRVYVVLGCGEIQEGQIWEAAMYAGHHKIDRLTAIIDWNKLQLALSARDTLDLEPLAPKWEAFGWAVFECDGHNVEDLVKTIDEAKKVKGKPQVVIAHTVKGKGVSFAENAVGWHAKAPNKEEMEKALEELARQQVD